MGKRGRPPVFDDEAHAAARERYAKDKEHRERRKTASREWQARKRAEFVAWRNTQTCYACGDDRGYVLDFHHVDGREERGSTLKDYATKPAAFRQRCEESVILCANCHRWAHHLLTTDPEGYKSNITSLPRVGPVSVSAAFGERD